MAKDHTREPLIGLVASLAAAISLLENTPKAKKAAASDKMFEVMLSDYRKALEAGREFARKYRDAYEHGYNDGCEWQATHSTCDVAQPSENWRTAVDLTEKSILSEYYSGRLNGDRRIKEGFKNLRAALAAQPPAAPVETGMLGRENDAFHRTLRQYPEASKALHAFWNDAFAGQPQPDPHPGSSAETASALALADEIEQAMTEFLETMGEQAYSSRRIKAVRNLKSTLWDNKAGIIAYPQSAHPHTLRNRETAMIDKSEPAFPLPGGAGDFTVQKTYLGMTLRDYFAAQALLGILSGPASRPNVPLKEWFDIPEQAYKLADEMLAARSGAPVGGSRE